jgi:hypothetical protein
MTRALFAGLVVLAACSANGLAFKADTAVKLLDPTNGGHVGMPFTLRWKVNDQTLQQQLAGGQRQLAIFFDRPPMRAGETFHAVADKQCRQTPGCPDAAYLSSRSIFVTNAAGAFPVTNLPDNRTSHKHTDEHDVTIVVVDAKGQRQGEGAYQAEFAIARPAGSG